MSGEDGGSQLVNADAERTLLRIKQKLEGVEGGECRGEKGGGSGSGARSGLKGQGDQDCVRMYHAVGIVVGAWCQVQPNLGA